MQECGLNKYARDDEICYDCLTELENDVFCLSCADPNTCTKCDEGHFLVTDQNKRTFCEVCTDGLGVPCDRCTDSGVCLDCETIPGCIACDDDGCLQCESGLYLFKDGDSRP